MTTTYLVVAAVVQDADHILLVRQQGPTDVEPTWALPGGVVEAGEWLTEALAREMQEETGLTVHQVGPLAYVTQFEDSASQTRTLAFVFEVLEWAGLPHNGDPDGLVQRVEFTPLPEAVRRLQYLPWPHMREPALAYLQGDAARGAVWFYRS